MPTKRLKPAPTEQLEDLLKAHALRRLVGGATAEQHAPSPTAPKRTKAKRPTKPARPSKPSKPTTKLSKATKPVRKPTTRPKKP
jgi:hypothetical protein